eukprot:gene4225-6001_t
MGLQNLLSEPMRLNSEAERLNTELVALVMDNYRVFIENLTCSVHLRSEDKKLGDISTDLDRNLHDLSQQCYAFKDRVNHFVNSHKRNRKTLQHDMQLVELLEVPQLVDACSRNGFHDEALELANFVNGLERRHLLASEVRSLNGKVRGGSGVVQSIVDDVHITLTGLRQQLLYQLSENTSLPKEIQILSTLRKLDGLLIDRHISLERHENELVSNMSDQQREILRQHLTYSSEIRLQMDFLEARTVWLDKLTENIDQNSLDKKNATSIKTTSTNSSSNGLLGPYGNTIEMLEAKRTSWFKIITEFKALFEDNNSSQSSSISKNGSLNHSDFSPVLNAWTTRQVHLLLNDLRNALPLIDDGTSLRSILEQSLFFAGRMSETGCDFSSLLLPLFEDVIIMRFSKELNKSFGYFKEMVATEKINFDREMGRDQIIPLFSPQDSNVSNNTIQDMLDDSSTITNNSKSNDELGAPSSVLKYPPVAYLLNCLLVNLNYLRECPLVTTKEAVLNCLISYFQSIAKHLVDNASSIRQLGTKYYGDGYMRDFNNNNPNNPVVKGIKSKQESNNLQASATSAVVEYMDHTYAKAFAYELIPHILVCYETVYQLNNFQSIVSKSSDNKIIYATMKNINDYREILTPVSIKKLENLWNLLIKDGLLSS